ncbi:MAG: class I SAM-dependent methyltransferase [Candidatus Shapirobacteria bacterium]
MLNSQAIYDEFAPFYRKYSKEKKEYIDTIDKIISDYCVKKTIIKMIDLGCGDGVRGKSLAQKIKPEVIKMVDNSEKMIERAKKLCGVKIAEGDFSEKRWREKDRYEVVICLWNVLGHISSYKKRLWALKNIRSVLAEEGVAFVDLSNRYNVKYYGWSKVWKNIKEDLKRPSYKNGNFKYLIDVGLKKIPSVCHFFNPWEMEKMIREAGLKIKKRYFINYENGKIEKYFWSGHIFSILEKQAKV